MTRNRQIIEFVLANPGCSLGQIEAAIPVDATLKSARTIVATHVHLLLSTGKLERTGRPRQWRYTATKTALVDKRLKTTEAKPKRTRKPATAKAAPPAPNAATRPLPPPPTPEARQQLKQLLVRAVPRPNGPLTSQQLAADLAEFKRRGGRIEVLKDGDVSQHFRYLSVRDLNEGTWQERTARQRHAQQDDVDEDFADAA